MMIFLFLITALVYQHGDTLVFIKQDSVVDKWTLNREIQQTDSIRVIKRAKISPDNKYFFILEETCASNNELLQTKITFYNADKRRIWEEYNNDSRNISFDLSNIYDRLFIIVEADKYNRDPALSIIKDRKKDVIIEPGEWQRIVNYKVSSNCRYLVLHTKNPYSGKVWDYICFFDLETKNTWEYLFPICLSCKRRSIDLDVDNKGQTDIVYKDEHRIFSREGKLIDIFIKLE